MRQDVLRPADPLTAACSLTPCARHSLNGHNLENIIGADSNSADYDPDAAGASAIIAVLKHTQITDLECATA